MRQLSDFRCQRKGGPSVSCPGGGGRGGSWLLAAKVRVDFWQADVRIGVSQESAGLLTSFILLTLGPVSLLLSSNSPQKFLSNNLVQAFSQTGQGGPIPKYAQRLRVLTGVLDFLFFLYLYSLQ